MELAPLLRFLSLIHQLQLVKRSLFANGEERQENDVEHQYQLAMIAWYIIDSEKLPLDVNLVLKYSLIHDVVEVFAGDTYFVGDRSGKDEREHASALRLLKEFPEFADLHSLIAAYEKRADKESIFVYALDKLLPVLNIYLDHGRTWKAYGITCEMLEVNKAEKTAGSPVVKEYFNQILARLKKEEPELFAHPTAQET